MAAPALATPAARATVPTAALVAIPAAESLAATAARTESDIAFVLQFGNPDASERPLALLTVVADGSPLSLAASAARREHRHPGPAA